jgi:hypothetical protein
MFKIMVVLSWTTSSMIIIDVATSTNLAKPITLIQGEFLPNIHLGLPPIYRPAVSKKLKRVTMKRSNHARSSMKLKCIVFAEVTPGKTIKVANMLKKIWNNIQNAFLIGFTEIYQRFLSLLQQDPYS